MANSTVKISGQDWQRYCCDDPSRWLELINYVVADEEYGQGSVVNVRVRENASPVISISFDSQAEFNGESFEDPAVSVLIPDQAAKNVVAFIDAESRRLEQEKQDQARKDFLDTKSKIERIKSYLQGYSLWHMTHISNVEGIVENGLLCHTAMRDRGMAYEDISNRSAQDRRQRKDHVYGRWLHEYVPLYINPRNAMISALREMNDDLCILEVSAAVIVDYQCVVCDGNAASPKSKDHEAMAGLDSIDWEAIRKGSWFDDKELRRKICAEVLVPNEVPKKYILSVRCFSDSTAKRVGPQGFKTLTSPEMYF